MSRYFISYSRKDEKIVTKVVTALEDAGLSTWHDLKDIREGYAWDDEIQLGLDDCDVMLLFISPESMISKNVKKEWSYFLDEEKQVIPVILKPTRLQFRLRDLQWFKEFTTSKNNVAIERLIDVLKGNNIYLTAPQNDDLPRNKSLTGIAVFFSIISLIILGTWWILSQNNVDSSEEVFFLVDRSINMAEIIPDIDGGGVTRYDATRGIISRIFNSRQVNLQSSDTWFGLQLAGGGEGDECDVVSPSAPIQQMGSGTTAARFTQALDVEPTGNTAYAEGFNAVSRWARGQYSSANNSKLLFMFLGSDQANEPCRNVDVPDLKSLIDTLDQANIALVVCAFSFFADSHEFTDYYRELSEQGIECVHNIRTVGDIETTVDIAIDQIERLRTNSDTITETRTPIFIIDATLQSEDRNVQLRAGPGLQYEVSDTTSIDLIHMAMEDYSNVLEISDDESWLLIRLPNATEGWIAVEFESSDSTPEPTTPPTMTMSLLYNANALFMLLENPFASFSFEDVTIFPVGLDEFDYQLLSSYPMPRISSTTCLVLTLTPEGEPFDDLSIPTFCERIEAISNIRVAANGAPWLLNDNETPAGAVNIQVGDFVSYCQLNTSCQIEIPSTIFQENLGFQYTSIVTYEAFLDCLEISTVCELPGDLPGNANVNNEPVNVTWISAQNYCTYLGGRLPTADELESINSVLNERSPTVLEWTDQISVARDNSGEIFDFSTTEQENQRLVSFRCIRND